MIEKDAHPLPKVMLAVLSVVLFYLGAGNTFLARYAGTCTMGDSERLFGITITAALSFAAIWAMRRSGYQRIIFVLIAPVLLVLAGQSFFSIRLAYGVLWQRVSACEVMDGDRNGEALQDGTDVYHSIVWPLVSAAMWWALINTWHKRATKT